MSKYIDAEKLIAELRRQKRELEFSIQSRGDYGQSCQIIAYENIISLIDSLQQEQSEVDLEKEIERYTEEMIHLPITHKRTPMDIMESDWIKCARHFWNKGYIAGKEK